MIGDSDGNADIGAVIEILQQRIDDTLDFATLRIVAQLRYSVEFIQQQSAPIAIGESKEIGDIASCGAEKRAYEPSIRASTTGKPSCPAR